VQGKRCGIFYGRSAAPQGSIALFKSTTPPLWTGYVGFIWKFIRIVLKLAGNFVARTVSKNNSKILL
jgi:hypothetical protein